jgi:cytoskeletal protein CcmA (bactofilin family)
MQRMLAYLLTLSLITSFSIAQNDDYEDRIDQSADNFEKFVEGIVNRIESQVDQMVDERSQSADDRENDVYQDKENEKTKIPADAVTFNGNTEIAQNDTVQGDLVVKNGTLIVRGLVNGDILVVNGDIELKNTSRILGNVRAMNGGISKDDGAYVEGFTEQSTTNTNSKKYRRKTTYRTKYSYSFKPYFWNSENVFDDNFLFRYNRVEGLFLGIGSEKKFYWDGSKAISGYGSFGYGFTSHKWRMQLGLDRQFATSDETIYEFGGEAHSLTDTKDEWIMALSENNLAALLFREDFRDYYQREGYSLHTARYTKDGDVSTMIDIRFLNDRYASLNTGAEWAVFGGNSFRPNPLVNAGTMKSVTFSAGLSTVEKYRYHSEGWNLYARGEYGGNELGGDFDFTQAMIDIRRFQPISDDDQLNVRIRAGALEGTPIAQKDFQLGGANTLPAYGFKEFSGNRMLLANLEYRLSGEIIDEIFFFPNSLSLIAFGDAGAVTTVNTTWAVFEGFTNVKSSQVRSDYGVAVAWHDGDARLGFAWRTDKQAPVSIFFRLNKAF